MKQSVAGGSGFGLCFMTLPTLFNNWGPQFAPIAGFLWFGLLFLAAITSSLAMGQPVMAFLEEKFELTRVKAAWALMGMLLLLAVPVAMIHGKGVFDDFDFWVGTFALVVFALVEVILFAWVFGMDRGWDELMRGAELKVPRRLLLHHEVRDAGLHRGHPAGLGLQAGRRLGRLLQLDRLGRGRRRPGSGPAAA